MAYSNSTKFHEDSDADDEFERQHVSSPTLPAEYDDRSPTSSGMPSAEHTPTTFTHSRDSKSSPTGHMMEWNEDQTADFIADLGLEQYSDDFASRWHQVHGGWSLFANGYWQTKASRAMCWLRCSMPS
jgi:hypothetical protein